MIEWRALLLDWRMNLKSKISYSLFAICAFFFLLPVTGTAQCACVKPNITALEEYKDASVVFTGEIIDIQKTEPDKQYRYYETVKVSAVHAWKKNVDSIVTIKNYIHGCVQGWKVGDKYLVYAYLNEDKVTYSTGCCCSRTGPLEKTANDESEFFEAGYARSNVSIQLKEKIISAGWMNSRAINFKPPQYPPNIKLHQPARVDVKITTDVEGNVISADIIRGPVRFHNLALEAAEKLRFPPILLSGVPTKVSGWVSFDFRP